MTGCAEAVARIVASLKGPYILVPAPKSVLQPRYARLGLTRYPVRDSANNAVECDPFDPAMRARLPSYLVDDHLGAALVQFGQIDAPLPAAVANRVYHIRSYDTAGNGVFEMQWKVSAQGQDPISHNGGMYDGTVPFWAARLAETPDAHVFDVSGVPHGGAAENPTVLKIIWDLMNGRAVAPGAQPTTPGPTFGPLTPVKALLAQVQAGTRPVADLTALPPPEFRTLTRGFTLG